MNVFLLLALAALPQAVEPAAVIDPALAERYFAEARAVAARDAGQLWGRTLASPLIFAEPRTREVVASTADAEGRLTRQGNVYVGKLPDDVTIANYAVDWSGTQWTMVRWPLPENRYTRQRLLAHEMFHRLQSALGLPASDVANAHLAIGEGRILMRLEWRALAEALIRDDAARRSAIADALLFRQRRRELFERAAEEERLLELNEGLAEYTGFKLSGLPDNVLADRAAVQLGSYENTDNFARSFAYASGPAYGLLLDAVHPQWRKQVNASTDLGALLQSVARVTIPRATQLDQRIAAYAAERMVQEERARAARFAALQNELRAKLVDGPTLSLPVGSQFSYGFDPAGAIPLEGLGTVYQNVRVSDEWGVLEVESGGALLLRPDRLITGVRVPAPPDPQHPGQGNGWKLTINAGWAIVPTGNGGYEVKRSGSGK